MNDNTMRYFPLESARKMDDFIHELAHYKITNCNGSAHCDHVIAYTQDGIVLISDHHVSYACRIKIADRKDIKIHPGDHDSRSHGNPQPRVREGELTTVWDSGRWVLRGPWENRIEELIMDLEERLEAAKIKERQDALQKRKDREELEAKHQKTLESNWN